METIAFLDKPIVKTVKGFKVKFTKEEILKMDNLLVSSIVSKYNQENQWDNKDAFQAAKEVLSSVVNSKIKAIDNSEMEEYCTNQMKHARTYCFCGNHASFREILNGGF